MANDILKYYEPNTCAWFEDAAECWIQGVLKVKNIDSLKVLLSFELFNGNKRDIIASLEDLLMKKIALPYLCNSPSMDTIDNLTNLSYLHEPAVLHTIKARYQQNNIYTDCGIVLIALNPFQKVPLYTPDIVRAYSGKRRGELEPHIFAVAEEAFRNMIREEKNQTIIISGESGAGKTVSAKYIMSYFAKADTHLEDRLPHPRPVRKAIEEQVLATNPITESFGNSKTTRNDNSSRFGKYIEVLFNKSSSIVGARLRTYLLERSRVVTQPFTERNYHIFYQLCAGAPAAETIELDLGEYTKFNYLRQGKCGVISGVDDAVDFENTQRALSTIGIPVSLQWNLFRILAGILHIGNVEIKGRPSGDSYLPDNDPSLLKAMELLQVNSSDFIKCVTKKKIQMRSETITTNLNLSSSLGCRDSVARYIYTSLFDWLIKKINESLLSDDSVQIHTFIGVLDIYGFEHFKKNSFEQFCINYANEKLQQEFNRHVFKLEQEEYVKEKIDWSFIPYNDNQPCIELIEGKIGLLSLLDEESRLPSGLESSLLSKYFQNFAEKSKHSYFSKPRFASNSFVVHHYANQVTYEVDGFIDKNKDTLSEELLTLLSSSNFDLLREILVKSDPELSLSSPTNGPKSMGHKPTLGSGFKSSLNSLMETIRGTDVNYIRCIKPNEAKAAFEFDPNLVVSQLRACGVLETIKMSCAGYPSRWTIPEFVQRYYILLDSKYWNDAIMETCKRILDIFIVDTDKYQIGVSKVFLRAGQLAYLDNLRAKKLNECATIIQKSMLCFLHRRKYLQLRKATIWIQCRIRGKLARKELQRRIKQKAAITIQKYWRSYKAQVEYKKIRKAITNIQSAFRMYQCRKLYIEKRRTIASINIQRVYRGYCARKIKNARLKSIILVQSLYRRRKAIKVLKALRFEAKSVSHLKEKSANLELKVKELTKALDKQVFDNKIMLDKIMNLERNSNSSTEKMERLKEKYKQLEEKLNQEKQSSLKDKENSKEISRTLESRDSTLKNLENENKCLRDKLSVIENLRKNIQYSETSIQTDISGEDIGTLKEEIEKLKHNLAKVTQDLVITTPSSLDRRRSQRNATTETSFINTIDEVLPVESAPSNSEQTIKVVEKQEDRSIKKTNIEEQTGVNTSDQDNKITSKKNRPGSIALPISPVNDNATTEKMGRNSMFEFSRVRMKSPVIEHFDIPLLPGSNSSLQTAAKESYKEKMLQQLLSDPELIPEIGDGLISKLTMPVPSSHDMAKKNEIHYPAHMIGLCLTRMIEYNLFSYAESLSIQVLKRVMKKVEGFSDTVSCAFWLSNVQELRHLLECFFQQFAKVLSFNDEIKSRAHMFGQKLVKDLKFIEHQIYQEWMRHLKSEINKLAVPAIIETESLPGFAAASQKGFLSRLLTSPPPPSATTQDLINFLSKTLRALKYYYIQESIIVGIMQEMLRLIGVVSFNHLLVRRNFSTWKRGMQIQYNVQVVNEWCANNGIVEGAFFLECVFQAAKLFQLRKTNTRDIEIILDACFLLNPCQIRKLLSLYHTSDYEARIPLDLINSINSKQVVTDNSEEILFLPTNEEEDSKLPTGDRELISTVDGFLPQWILSPKLRELISLSC